MNEEINVRRLQRLERSEGFIRFDAERDLATYKKRLFGALEKSRGGPTNSVFLELAANLRLLFPNEKISIPPHILEEGLQRLKDLRKDDLSDYTQFTFDAVRLQRLFGKKAIGLGKNDYMRMQVALQNAIADPIVYATPTGEIAENIKQLFPELPTGFPEAEIGSMWREAVLRMTNKKYSASAYLMKQLRILYPERQLTLSDEEWSSFMQDFKSSDHDADIVAIATYATDLAIMAAKEIRYDEWGIKLISKATPSLLEDKREIPSTLEI